MVRKIKPKTVVEFGTGWSTVTIAAALNENFRLSPEEYGGVRPINHVIEAPDKWVDIVKKCLPGHLDEFCRFYLSTPKITVSNGELCSQYETLPDVSPDLIYVDGPGSSQIVGNINGLSMGRQVVADVKLYENKMSRECTVIIDSRLANLNWYLRNLVGYYRCTYVPLAEQAVLQKVEKLPPLRNNRNWLSALSSNRKFRRYLENEKNSTKIISLKGNYSLLP